jgi:hypothetical protein
MTMEAVDTCIHLTRSEVAMRIGTNVATGGYVGTMRNPGRRGRELTRMQAALIACIGGAMLALLGTAYFVTHAGVNYPDAPALAAP